jgi:hypothetical protein
LSEHVRSLHFALFQGREAIVPGLALPASPQSFMSTSFIGGNGPFTMTGESLAEGSKKPWGPCSRALRAQRFSVRLSGV